MGTHIYHITHIDNLPEILQEGGLWCDNMCPKQGLRPVNIAYSELKRRRATTQVALGRQGTLADYVPFYFAPRSPMLYAINKGYVAGYQGGQEPVLHLAASVEDVHRHGLPFAFTDGHAAQPMTRFFADLKDLDQLDWEIMKATY